MTYVFELPKVEKIIESVASRFKISGLDFEDLVQIGRIAVWQLAEQMSIDEANQEKYYGLIFTRVKQVLISEQIRANAKKRIKPELISSLDDLSNKGLSQDSPEDTVALSGFYLSEDLRRDTVYLKKEL